MAGYCTQCGGTGTRGTHGARVTCGHCFGSGFRKPARLRQVRTADGASLLVPANKESD